MELIQHSLEPIDLTSLTKGMCFYCLDNSIIHNKGMQKFKVTHTSNKHPGMFTVFCKGGFSKSTINDTVPPYEQFFADNKVNATLFLLHPEVEVEDNT